MLDNLIQELEEFLKIANLSMYEINAYKTLLQSKDLTAREISTKSNVPTGRIYEVLDDLYNKGMITFQDIRPKIYNPISFNRALDNLISFHKNKKKMKIQELYDLATRLESKIYDSEIFVKKEPSKIFWSRYFGTHSIIDQYVRNLYEVKSELLLTGFITGKTIELLPFLKNVYNGIYDAVNRGVAVKFLWCYEFDNRPLTYVQILNNRKMFGILVSTFKKLFDLKIKKNEFEMRFIHRKIPNYIDIFDREKIMIKMQNLANPTQIFTCLNIVDLKLAENFRKKFLTTWLFEAIEDNPEAYKNTLWEQLEQSFLR